MHHISVKYKTIFISKEKVALDQLKLSRLQFRQDCSLYRVCDIHEGNLMNYRSNEHDYN